MSEMVSNKGIIKELYPEIEGVEQKVTALAKALGKPFEEVAKNYSGYWEMKDYHTYAVINNRLFDISGAPDRYDDDYEDRNNIKRLSANELEVDLYYYNGGTSKEELIGEYLADEPEFKPQKKNCFYAAKLFDGTYLTRVNSAGPALYMTREQAERTLLKHAPGYADKGYVIVLFTEA